MLSLYKPKKSAIKHKRRYGTSKPWATYNPRRALFSPSDPYSDSFVHKFRRMAGVARLYAGPGNIPTLSEDSGPGARAYILGSAVTDSVAGANLAQFGMTYSCHLDSVLNYQDFVDLFNEYKIDKVDLRIDLINGPSGAPNVASILPELYVRYDPNDATMPSSFGDLAQSANCAQFNFSQKTSHHYTFVPKASMLAYAPGLAAVGYAAPTHSSMWFDTTGPSNTIEMYGLKMWWRNFESTLGGAQIFQFQPTFFLSARRPR